MTQSLIKLVAVTFVLLSVAVGLRIYTLVAYALWEDLVAPRLCPSEQRIETEALAVKFAQNHFRSNGHFWYSVGLDEGDLDRLFAGNCCNVSKVKVGLIEPDRWQVYIGGGRPGYGFFYELTFSTCGKNVDLLKTAEAAVPWRYGFAPPKRP